MTLWTLFNRQSKKERYINMTLPREVYQVLEDIVGPRNITEEPATLAAYAFNFGNELYPPYANRFSIRPTAVLLPGGTEEVQAIVKACNRYKIKYKPFTTGWGSIAGVRTENSIQLDLRRMDRILEIDEKNMFAIVEPYAMGGTLQAEAMKVGLNCNMPGAGAAVSPLANGTSQWGHGPPTLYFGHNSEVLLGIEWVMPNGEILKTGSLGSGVGWFCGEGPGPSLRALIRGDIGAQGNLGVFTKAALKLSPWPGPTELKVDGKPPAYHVSLPENFRMYTLTFPNWRAFADAAHKIYDAEIGYICHRQWHKLGKDLAPAFFLMYSNPTKTLDDLEEMLKDPEIQKFTKEMGMPLPIVLAGQTPNDIEYQEKVLDQILAETGGHKVAKMSEPDIEKFTLLYFIRWGHKNLNFVYAGGYIGSWHQYGTPDFNVKYAQVAEKTLSKYQATGLLVQAGGDAMMGPIARMGGGGTFSLEQFTAYDPANKESVEAVVKYILESAELAKDHGFPSGFDEMAALRFKGAVGSQAYLENLPDNQRFQWQWKIKHMLDPNDAGEAGTYWMVKPKE
jgi:glycolate oxidase